MSLGRQLLEGRQAQKTFTSLLVFTVVISASQDSSARMGEIASHALHSHMHTHTPQADCSFFIYFVLSSEGFLKFMSTCCHLCGNVQGHVGIL